MAVFEDQNSTWIEDREEFVRVCDVDKSCFLRKMFFDKSCDEKGEYDSERDRILLEWYDIKTIRYTAEQVEKNLQGVCDDVVRECGG